MNRSTKNNDIAVAIVTYPGVQMSAVLGLGDLFSIASKYATENEKCSFVISDISPPEKEQNSAEIFDAVIVPSNLAGERGKGDFAIHAWLQNQHASGALICSFCAGAFWLGHSGLLNGRPATTHWLAEEEFRAEFPETKLEIGDLLIDDGDIVTAGGLMAWLDLGLYLVSRFIGEEEMSFTAKHLLFDPGGREQRNYRSFRPNLGHGDNAVLELQHWLEKHLDKDCTVKSMASLINLSERTFIRKFKDATGLSPASYVKNLRIERARRLLESTRLPVAEVGWRVGYHDPSAFSRIFQKLTGTQAGEYQRRFKVRTNG